NYTPHHGYSSSHGHYPSHSSSSQPPYNNTDPEYSYYTSSPVSPSSNPPASPLYAASPISPTGSEADYSSRYSYPRPQSTRGSSEHPYSPSYAYSSTNGSQHSAAHPYGRPRSHSQAYSDDYNPPTPTHQYHQQIPLSPALPLSPAAYPSSPHRPFACDLCALSFNRQHDLKRHRETHTGEKPFLCNGGCGKTFTRKDALKRHQLVKGCGKVEEPRS
ncbi:hypothetical protein DFP72DRAFT_776768, partial [Ephemerocybe angulata]